MTNSSQNRGIYYRPIFVVIRLEALWTMRIAYARFATRCINSFLGKFPKLPKNEYQPAISGRAGYDARLLSFSIENSLKTPELEGYYPDW